MNLREDVINLSEAFGLDEYQRGKMQGKWKTYDEYKQNKGKLFIVTSNNAYVRAMVYANTPEEAIKLAEKGRVYNLSFQRGRAEDANWEVEN